MTMLLAVMAAVHPGDMMPPLFRVDFERTPVLYKWKRLET